MKLCARVLLVCGITAPGGKRHHLEAWLRLQFPHAYEVLRDLRQPLLVLVHQEFGPVGQVLIDLRHGSEGYRDQACKWLAGSCTQRPSAKHPGHHAVALPVQKVEGPRRQNPLT